MTTVADYLGRIVDVLAFPGAKAQGEALLKQELASKDHSGYVCTGIQKLAQRFLLELLTEKGSMKYLPSRGTSFMIVARQGRLLTELDVRQEFNLALVDIERNLQAEENTTMPTDEQYDGSSLLSITIQPGFLSLRINVRSRAGTNRAVILPLPVTV